MTNADDENLSEALDALGRPGHTGEFGREHVDPGTLNPLSRWSKTLLIRGHIIAMRAMLVSIDRLRDRYLFSHG